MKLEPIGLRLVYDVPNDSTPFVFTCNIVQMMLHIIFVCLLHIEKIKV